MKYKVLGLSILLAAAFTACDNYEEPNPQPQTNEQGSILNADEVAFNSIITAGTVYDLQALNDEGTLIGLATFTAPELGDYYDYKVYAQLSKDGFNTYREFVCDLAEGEANTYTATIDAKTIQDIYVSYVSKGPKAKDVSFRFQLTTVSNGTGGSQEAYIGSPETFFGQSVMTIKPFPTDLVIEEAYYLIGTACDWDMTAAIKLSNSGIDPYDDPVFSAKFDVTPGGWWWKIVPQSVFETGNWGSGPYSQFGVEENGDESFAGMLFAHDGATEPGAGCLQVDATTAYLLTINMEEGTYEFSTAIECLYTPGGSNGWNQTASQILTTTDYVNYGGCAHLNGEFKFTSAPDWNHINYGAAAEEGKLSTDGGAGNLLADVDGLYYVQANIAALTYSLYHIESLGIIGSATPNGWDASTALTPSADFLVWTGTVALTEGEFKFRANDAWDVDFGGTLEDVTYKGANIPVAEAGTYTITVDFSTVPYTCTLSK